MENSTAYPQLKPGGQCARLLKLLQDHPEGVTALEIVQQVGCLQYNARIFDLRRLGHTIDEVDEVDVENGKMGRYFLREPEAVKAEAARRAMMSWGR